MVVFIDLGVDAVRCDVTFMDLHVYRLNPLKQLRELFCLLQSW